MKSMIIGLLSLLLSATSFAQGGAATAPMQEPQIAKIMEVANESEVDAAKVAERKAQDPQVKAYAQKMRTVHGQNQKEMKRLTKDKRIELENNEVARKLKESNKATMKEMKDKEGAEFDRAFISSQVEMHQNLLNQLDGQFIPSAQTPEFKQFLSKTREHVKNHLDEAKSLQSSPQ